MRNEHKFIRQMKIVGCLRTVLLSVGLPHEGRAGGCSLKKIWRKLGGLQPARFHLQILNGPTERNSG